VGAILYLAALTTIDESLYEAALIDSANRWKLIGVDFRAVRFRWYFGGDRHDVTPTVGALSRDFLRGCAAVHPFWSLPSLTCANSQRTVGI
jgi:hypothetical protein